MLLLASNTFGCLLEALFAKWMVPVLFCMQKEVLAKYSGLSGTCTCMYIIVISVSQRGAWVSFRHPVSILDTLHVFHLSFTYKSIVSEQFGHPVLKFPVSLDTLILNPG